MSVRISLPSRPVRLRLFYATGGLLVAVPLAFPLLYLIFTSFKSDAELLTIPPTVIPHEWTLESWRVIARRGDVMGALKNSLIVTVAAASLTLSIAAAFAYATTRFRFPLDRFFSFLMLFVYVLPPVLLVIPIYETWQFIGIPEGPVPLTFTYLLYTLPLAIWLLRSYFNGLPIDLEEAASVDGASRVQVLRKIVLPLARPGMIATFVFIAVLAWQEVLYATVFASRPGQLVLSSFLANVLLDPMAGSGNFNELSAIGVVSVIPILSVFWLVQKQLMSGVMAGGVKG